MPLWMPIAKLDDIPLRGARRVSRPLGPEVAVFRCEDDQVFAVLDRCPHKGGPLSQGIVFGNRVSCPLHQWTIGLSDGCAQAPDVGCTVPFAVQVVDGLVYLCAKELSTLAVNEPGDAAVAPPSVARKPLQAALASTTPPGVSPMQVT
jgi:nitrite reductase (NADH) small subunit